MLTRRSVISRATHLTAGLLTAGTLGPAAVPVLAADEASAIPRALDRTDLVYLTPLVGERESKCQAEVWFVHHDGKVWVVTAHDAWRAKAIRNGHDKARLWIGDLGVWTETRRRYRDLPTTLATGRQVDTPETHTALLQHFGRKYRLEWLAWGPRFQGGLADGSRVLLEYTLPA